jgi:predicted transcriptional regulator
MKRYSFFLSDKQIAALKRIAEGTGVKTAEIIRRAVDEFIKRAGAEM